MTGSVDDLKTPPSSTEPPDSVPCSTNLPPGGLPGSSGSGGIHGSRSVPSGLSNYDTGGGGKLLHFKIAADFKSHKSVMAVGRTAS